MSEEKQHKRRVHYSGKYPKKFEEKYKELNPEKYKDTIEHVISKGNTPAGMHISIMVKEIIDFLDIKPGQTGFDATLGYGGHTRAMLEKLEGQGHMFATDVDPIESEKTKKRLAEAGLFFCFSDEMREDGGSSPGAVGPVAYSRSRMPFLRNSTGVTPVILLKTRENRQTSEKPQAEAMPATVISVVPSSSIALATRNFRT